MAAPLSQRAKEAYDRYKKLKGHKDKDKAKGYYETVKKLLDEDTRSAELLRLGVNGLMKLGEKAVGTSLTKHPYFVYHELHLNQLGLALTSLSTHRNALNALDSAVRSADAAERLGKQLAGYTQLKYSLKYRYRYMLSEGLHMMRNTKIDPANAEREERATGQPYKAMVADYEAYLYLWRAEVCGLYFDAVELLAMAEVECRAAAAAMASYNRRLKQLQNSDKPLDRIAGHGLEYKRQMEYASRELNRIYSSSSNAHDPQAEANPRVLRPLRRTWLPAPDAQAVADPTRYAERHRDEIEEFVKAIATVCDAAMNDHVVYFEPPTLDLKVTSCR
jgi:hypothetical protein